MPLPAMHAGVENCRRNGRLTQKSAIKEAITKAEILRLQIEQLNPGSIYVSGSIGISRTPLSGSIGYEELFAAADQAVYSAKLKGRNCVV